MAKPEIDLRPLLWPGAAAALAALVLAGSWYGADAWLAERERAFDRARSELAAAARKYRNASDDQAVYEQYAARFREMAERGWIGAEQRLIWIEALQRINGDLGLPTLKYQIARREPASLPPGAGVDAGRLQLYRTRMELTVGALHEGDLLSVLDGLAERGKGLMAVERCRLERAAAAGEVRLAADATNVRARCTLDWYTLEIRPEEAAGS